MDLADYYWLIFLGAFVAFEIPAAIWRSEWTLSRHVWDWFAVGRPWKERYAALRWFILAGLTISTTLHFLVATSWIPIVIFGAGAAWSIWYFYAKEKKR